jgi:hypothetical protein
MPLNARDTIALPAAVGVSAVTFATFCVSLWWIFRRAIARQRNLRALEDATGLGAATSAKRLLVVRAIDDEASLALALGTIVNYFIARTITYLSVIFVAINLLLLFGLIFQWPSWLPEWAYAASLGAFTAVVIILGGVLMLSRSVHGRELALAPMDCQINTQSAPDAVDLSKIVTLVSQNYAKSLRHGIYEHENCAKTISDWVRSQHITCV